MLFQLIYISTARPSIILTDVEDILQSSRRRNTRDGISGLLIFDGKRFLQALEGPHPMVEATFGRIAVDDRHRALVKLSERAVDRQEFGNWSMASHLSGPVLGGGDLVAMVDSMTEGLTDANVRATLRGFARVRGAN